MAQQQNMCKALGSIHSTQTKGKGLIAFPTTWDELGMLGHIFNPSRQKQEDLCEFVFSLLYIVISRTARAIQKDPVPKSPIHQKEKKKKENPTKLNELISKIWWDDTSTYNRHLGDRLIQGHTRLYVPSTQNNYYAPSKCPIVKSVANRRQAISGFAIFYSARDRTQGLVCRGKCSTTELYLQPQQHSCEFL